MATGPWTPWSERWAPAVGSAGRAWSRRRRRLAFFPTTLAAICVMSVATPVTAVDTASTPRVGATPTGIPTISPPESPTTASSARAGAQSATPVPTAPAVAAAKDLVSTGYGDTRGWHVYLASPADGWAWHPVATIQPGGYEDEGWIGQQCLTGDGQYVVAVIAPWHAASVAAEFNQGAVAYSVSVATGSVVLLARNVSLAYFNPGCGIDHRVALAAYPRRDEGTTYLGLLDASSGQVLQRLTATGELTSPTPSGSDILAARANRIIRIHQGSATQIASVDGDAYSLRAGGQDGGVVARELDISERTVETHVGRVFAKVGASSRVQLATICAARLMAPWVSPDAESVR